MLLHASKNVAHFVETTHEDVVFELRSSSTNGLTSGEAAERLKKHGPNELVKDPPKSFLKLLAEQFENLLVIMLIASAITSAALREIPAAVTIIVIVILNAGLGVIQEYRAGAAIEALQNMSEPKTMVVRDGNPVEVESLSLVPGDIVILDNGRSIPADIRMVETAKFQSNEAPLTGESEPVKKDANYVRRKTEQKETGEHGEEKLTEANMVFMGCSVTNGRGKGIVVHTGMATKMGEIAKLLKTATSEPSPLQRKLARLGVRLGVCSIVVSIVVFIVGVTLERGVDPEDGNPAWLQMLLVAVSLTVAAVPEGLPTAVTITLAVGMERMAKKNAKIRSLHSVETLGSASVICSDKTGTLTHGVMTAVRLWFGGKIFRITGSGYNPEGAIFPYAQGRDAPSESDKANANGPHILPLAIGVLCSNAQLVYDNETKEHKCVGDTTERPIVVAGYKAGIDSPKFKAFFPRILEHPFNSTRKMMSTLVECPGGVPSGLNLSLLEKPQYVACVKGAANIIVQQATAIVDSDGVTVRSLSEAEKGDLLRVIDDLSAQAFRVLCIGVQVMPNNMNYKAMSKDDLEAQIPPEVLERNLILCGMIASIDPERQAVAPSIRKAAFAGIRTVMITGDYVKTAKAIAENIGILPKGSPEKKAIDCSVIRVIGDKLEEVERELDAAEDNATKAQLKVTRGQLLDELDAITAYADVYARAKPSDKITIVKSLQRQGHVCSMTGDGVNDAPALKQANIGVAMGITGTDVAKAAASMVLVDDNFVSIVEAIEQGRTIYSNISKFVYYLLSTNVAEVFLILIVVLMGLQSPLRPIQILWLNLVTDGAPAIALAIEHTEPGIMEEGPRPQQESIVEKVMITGVIVNATFLTVLCIGVYIIGLYWNVGSWDGVPATVNAFTTIDGKNDPNFQSLEYLVNKARTMTIYYIVFAELGRAYSARSMRQSVFRMGFFSNKWMQWAVGTAVGATFAIGHIPGVRGVFSMEILEGREWGLVLGLASVPFWVDETLKMIYRKTGFGARPKAISPIPLEAEHRVDVADTKEGESTSASNALELPILRIHVSKSSGYPSEEKRSDFAVTPSH